MWICPAACHDEPEVSSFLSNRMVSFQPNLARWKRIEQPTTPPPIMTTRAWVGGFLGDFVMWDGFLLWGFADYYYFLGNCKGGLHLKIMGGKVIVYETERRETWLK